jgi:phosphohistidine phosphatase SixA
MKIVARIQIVLAMFVAAASALPLFGQTSSQTLAGAAMVSALQRGGYVIVMRHASSPRQVPDKQTANADNDKLERQLDEAGRASAVAMGNALRDLEIPVGVVLSSPTYRAIETARLAKLPNPTPVPELGDGGQSMQAVPATPGAWLQKKVTDFPKGTITILVTHSPNLTAAFPGVATNVADGEALVFGPDGKGGATLVGRIKIDEWARMK